MDPLKSASRYKEMLNQLTADKAEQPHIHFAQVLQPSVALHSLQPSQRVVIRCLAFKRAAIIRGEETQLFGSLRGLLSYLVRCARHIFSVFPRYHSVSEPKITVVVRRPKIFEVCSIVYTYIPSKSMTFFPNTSKSKLGSAFPQLRPYSNTGKLASTLLLHNTATNNNDSKIPHSCPPTEPTSMPSYLTSRSESLEKREGE